MPKSKKINLRENAYGKPLQQNFLQGFTYADCVVDDARLVIANAQAAANNGAQILTRHEFINAKRLENHWEIQLKNLFTNEIIFFQAKVLVNASGPFVNDTLGKIGLSKNPQFQLIKGSHIVTAALYEGNHAYILQNKDGRVIFTIPFVDNTTLIGTTDIPYSGDPTTVKIEDAEINYLLTAVNHYFTKTLTRQDIQWTYAGVRALVGATDKAPATLSRDFHLSLDNVNNMAPLLTIFSGKITTYRKLAESALTLLQNYFPQLKPAWTAKMPLPGGDIPQQNLVSFMQKVQQDFPQLPINLLTRYAKAYGSGIYELLDKISTVAELGLPFGHGLYEKEVRFLIQKEWAKTAEDILWRRTKLGLNQPQDFANKLKIWLAEQQK